MSKITVYVGKASEGSYWGTSQNYEGVVGAFGVLLMGLKNNFERAFFVACNCL